MIVRVSEARVLPDRGEEFLEALRALVAEFPARYEGLVSHEILIDAADSTRVQYVSRWVDESALVRFAGENWAVDPVTFPEEESYLTAPLTLRHFVV
ncbi:putative quinol monooxygenase [Microbacterium sp. SLBN-146]|uniref:putative quinol monooxygenase n=1 Tax=Microbacterium sp. SLBN-146 TaxID=2768457 RepID=UPI0011543AB1|nr:antibiotic biosynthesis monooxygenase [Microbacterium sp. SLBN-146]TQJ30331.1 antibiotic biosynthesis monooxygenase [Microbacterium sp. SLBN-146]